MSLRTRLAFAAIVIVVGTVAVTAALIMVAARSGWPGALPGLSLRGGAMVFATAAGLAIIPAVVAAAWLSRSITRPIDDAAAIAEAAAVGRASPPVVLGGGSESARLVASIVAIQHAVSSVIEVVQTAGQRLAAVDNDTTAALRHEQEAVRAFSGSASEITAAVAEISATSEQLLGATGDVMTSAREAAAVASDGRAGLERIAASIQHLDEAMNAFTRKLTTISQRAAGITAVVTTIAKVADQTNLLSVNATIEAEKAGESGRGFRIVAQEIRRLADQTAQSTKDIERLVRDMQAAVAGGTMEMDRFRNEVSSRMGEVATVSEQLGLIIDPVQSVTRSLEVVHNGMGAQSEGARQIRGAMESLRADAAESAASLEAFATAVEAIRGTAADLRDAAAHFRHDDGSIGGQPRPDGPPEIAAAR